jgi:hypothetical protein
MSIRSVLRSRGLRGAAIAGVMAAALATAGITVTAATALASTTVPHKIEGLAPTEECVTWSGTVQYFPVLTSSSQKVTAILEGTLSNCDDLGTPQAGSGSVFGVLSGTATKSKAALTGQLAVTWPAVSNLSPSIVPVSLRGASGKYSFGGIVSAGAGTGQELHSSYDKVKAAKASSGTLQTITGTSAFASYVNEG